MKKKYSLGLTKTDIDFVVDALIHRMERVATGSAYDKCYSLIERLNALIEEEE